MIETPVRTTMAAERAERLTAVPCPTPNPRTGRPCGYTLMEAWTSGVCIARRRCKQCGTWFRIRLTTDGAATVTPESASMLS